MLYHRLLRELTSVSKPFDFTALWKRLQLKSSATFSTRFLVQAGLLVENSTFPMTSLDGLVKAWGDTVQQANVRTIDPKLTIVYRLQPVTPRWNKRNKGKMRAASIGADIDIGITQEERDLALAIEASLKDLPGRSTINDHGLDTPTPKTDHELLPTPNGNDGQTRALYLERCSHISHSDPTVQSPSEIHDTDGTLDHLTIIGTKEFIYDEDFLDAHLAHILRWWHGHRKPEGVSLENSRRCL